MKRILLNWKKWLLGLIVFGLICLGILLILNGIIMRNTERYILTEDAAAQMDADCILVLGCGVRPDGRPTDMLYDRCVVGIRLYEAGASDRLLMSGDHSRTDYDEVNTMKAMATEAGIDPDAVFCDHAGFSTYESMYRARDIFQVKRMVIVTQNYHLYRALYVARSLGIEAYGVAANERVYRGQLYRDAREVLARVKDMGYCLWQPKPTYLGDVIPISGKGSATDG